MLDSVGRVAPYLANVLRVGKRFAVQETPTWKPVLMNVQSKARRFRVEDLSHVTPHLLDVAARGLDMFRVAASAKLRVLRTVDEIADQ